MYAIDWGDPLEIYVSNLLYILFVISHSTLFIQHKITNSGIIITFQIITSLVSVDIVDILTG